MLKLSKEVMWRRLIVEDFFYFFLFFVCVEACG